MAEIYDFEQEPEFNVTWNCGNCEEVFPANEHTTELFGYDNDGSIKHIRVYCPNCDFQRNFFVDNFVAQTMERHGVEMQFVDTEPPEGLREQWIEQVYPESVVLDDQIMVEIDKLDPSDFR